MKDINTNKTIVQSLDDGVSSHEFSIKKNSNLTLVLVAHGDKQVESTVTVKLSESGSSATILGVFLGTGKAKFSLHTLQQHEAPDTTSNLLIKTVLTDDAVSTYDGAIRVEPKAQKTDAYQRNENLLVSPNTKAVSSPGLEILANDVRCTHGATAGPIDEEELWYLSSRGIGKDEGEKLIMHGFLNDALLKIEDTKVRSNLQHQLGIGV